MRWALELWDGFDKVSKYFRDGIDFYEKYDEYLKERCIIENTYAKNLRDLAKKYEFPSNQKRTKSLSVNTNGTSNTPLSSSSSSDDTLKFTHLQCFVRSLGELKDMAGQHELIAENTCKRVIEKLTALIKSLKDDRRKLIENREHFYSIHQSKDEILKKSKQKYETSFKELEKAKEILNRVEADDSSSRNDIKKHQAIVNSKLTYCDSCKAEYAKNLLEANQIKNKYYTEQLPNLLNSFQNLEEKRIKLFQDFIRECVSIEKEVIPRIQRCFNEIDDASNRISIENDIESVVNLFKTGYTIPADHVFEDLSDTTSHKSNQTSVSTVSGTKRDNKYKTIHRIKGLFGSKNDGDPIYDLPPQQQKKELLKRIETLNSDILKEEKEKEGLLKLKEIYEMNQKFGDSQSALQALKQNEEKLHSLHTQLKKYQDLFQEFERTGLVQRPQASTTATSAKTPTSTHKQILNHSSSHSSLNTTTKTSIPGTPVSQHSNNLVQGGLTTIYTSNFRQKLSPNESFDNDDDDTHNDFAQDELDSPPQQTYDEFEQVLRTYATSEQRQHSHEETYERIDRQVDDVYIGEALVLYSFDRTVQNALSISEREMLKILERDSGDGWTLAKNLNGEKGYVPTGYIQITYY